ncbi:M20 family metallo-hydrolase [Tardisphaera saccharovorans]
MPDFSEYKEFAIDVMKHMIPLKSVSPAAGGEGEGKRADYLLSLINQIAPQAEIKQLDTKDEFGYRRPNIIAKLDMKKEKTVWVFSHMDTVSEGDLAAWKTNPYEAVVDGDKIYGRGTEDNGQALVASLVAMKALADERVDPKYNYAIGLVADEEIGSVYGLKYVVERYPFLPGDLYLVPDAGSPDGLDIEIAEKGVMWLKFTVLGVQSHGSMPSKNANRIAMKLLLQVDDVLHKKYDAKDPLFAPPTCTFEPTKREPNVGSINIVPGKDVSYFDCRILPKYPVADVLADVMALAREASEENGVNISVDPVVIDDPAPPTDPNSEVAQRLKSIIKRVRNVDARFVGIGGGTVAAVLRKKGYPAVAWSTAVETAHQPNEYCKISDLLADAQVFYAMAADNST